MEGAKGGTGAREGDQGGCGPKVFRALFCLFFSFFSLDVMRNNNGPGSFVVPRLFFSRCSLGRSRFNG